MPAPSLSTKPSRSLSNGRLAPGGSSLRVDRARADTKPPRPIGVVTASVPPVIMTSAVPYWMVRIASPTALAADAQAVETAVLTPHRSN